MQSFSTPRRLAVPVSANVLTGAAVVMALWWSGHHGADAAAREALALQAKNTPAAPAAAAAAAATDATVLPVVWPAAAAPQGDAKADQPARPAAAPALARPAGRAQQ